MQIMGYIVFVNMVMLLHLKACLKKYLVNQSQIYADKNMNVITALFENLYKILINIFNKLVIKSLYKYKNFDMIIIDKI